MTSFKPDNRISNTLLFLGSTFLALTYFTLTATSRATQLVWTLFLSVFGLLFIAMALLPRYIVHLTKDSIVIKNRLGLFTKTIPLSDIAKVKVIDKEYPVSMYNNNILHLFLWNKKFNRFKLIELRDLLGNKLFTIAGQWIDNKDFTRLVKTLKK